MYLGALGCGERCGAVLCCCNRNAGLPEAPRNVTSVSARTHPKHRESPSCDFCFGQTHGRGFLMFRTGTLQRQAPWTPVVVACAALGLALYYLRTRTSQPSSASNLSQVNQQPSCQAPDDLLAAMGPKERAYHERFMREAIAMVSQLLHPYQTK
jgi:hypothetical protein